MTDQTRAFDESLDVKQRRRRYVCLLITAHAVLSSRGSDSGSDSGSVSVEEHSVVQSEHDKQYDVLQVD